MCKTDNNLPIWKIKKAQAQLKKPTVVSISSVLDFLDNLNSTRASFLENVERLMVSLKSSEKTSEVVLYSFLETLVDSLGELDSDIYTFNKTLRFQKS